MIRVIRTPVSDADSFTVSGSITEAASRVTAACARDCTSVDLDMPEC